ncbi:hypothetical protein FGADI_417 [Fusarium gaditjirri]|uniref:Uncharacterized protein n=1 Tax=Fusarium gaditjirri TaxID=282569 RepID=A0A8H4TNI6_9HYPO|nr:hypothetical protein FGADI_417 [Fusarium gaditjirri]
MHSSEATLWTNVGPVVVLYDPSRDLWQSTFRITLKSHELSIKQGYPSVSIVKDVTYTLADFPNQSDLFAAAVGPSQPTELDEGWAPSFTGVIYYRVLPDPYGEDSKKLKHLIIRMIVTGLEDPHVEAVHVLWAYLAL